MAAWQGEACACRNPVHVINLPPSIADILAVLNDGYTGRCTCPDVKASTAQGHKLCMGRQSMVSFLRFCSTEPTTFLSQHRVSHAIDDCMRP